MGSIESSAPSFGFDKCETCPNEGDCNDFVNSFGETDRHTADHFAVKVTEGVMPIGEVLDISAGSKKAMEMIPVARSWFVQRECTFTNQEVDGILEASAVFHNEH